MDANSCLPLAAFVTFLRDFMNNRTGKHYSWTSLLLCSLLGSYRDASALPRVQHMRQVGSGGSMCLSFPVYCLTAWARC